MNNSALQALQSRLNYVKLVFLFLDVGGNLLVKTFNYLYQGPKPPEGHLVDLASTKSNNIYPIEKETLEKLKDGEVKISQLDITLSYKLVQLTCGLKPRNSDDGKLVWSKRCPKERRQCVEYLLFRYKDLRNKIIHDFRHLEVLYDEAFNKIRSKSEKLLHAIIIEVGIKAELTPDLIKEWQEELKTDMAKICEWNLGISGLPPAPTGDSKEAEAGSDDTFLGDFEDEMDFDGLPPKRRDKTGRDVDDDEDTDDESLDDAPVAAGPRGPSPSLLTRKSRSKTSCITGLFQRQRKKEKGTSLPILTNLKKKMNRKDSQPHRGAADEGSGKVDGEVLKSEIIRKYGKYLQDEDAEEEMYKKETKLSNGYRKGERNYWVNQLISKNVLDNNHLLHQFLLDYSMDQDT